MRHSARTCDREIVTWHGLTTPRLTSKPSIAIYVWSRQLDLNAHELLCLYLFIFRYSKSDFYSFQQPRSTLLRILWVSATTVVSPNKICTVIWMNWSNSSTPRHKSTQRIYKGVGREIDRNLNVNCLGCKTSKQCCITLHLWATFLHIKCSKHIDPTESEWCCNGSPQCRKISHFLIAQATTKKTASLAFEYNFLHTFIQRHYPISMAADLVCCRRTPEVFNFLMKIFYHPFGNDWVRRFWKNDRITQL